MKKKILVGLLSAAACFSLGSTPFADTAAAASAGPQITSSVDSRVITPSSTYHSYLTLSVGESRNLSGSGFWIASAPPYDQIYLNSQGLVIGLKPGVVTVMADLPGGDKIAYYITVK
ncbi:MULTISPECIES: hypothetical protein [Paenibacillus]|uniref:hypothetical protein n=1 Tax=Paenibacillus TaxID=44249 RepID=UPI00042522FE|nr:hypothetical protein [Paenibacillus massiliensis]